MRFDDWMRLALYHPQAGYYAREGRRVGRTGDFFTSVSVGPIFGNLLAVRIGSWLDRLAAANPNRRLDLVEAGAHDGQLALDILQSLVQLAPAWLPRLRLNLIEPLSPLQHRQRQTLARCGIEICWFRSLAELKRHSADRIGIFYSNELLDAFPILRHGWCRERQAWFEWRVGWNGERFVWERGALIDPVCSTDGLDREQALRAKSWNPVEQNSPRLEETRNVELEELDQLRRAMVPELQQMLPDGFTVESSPEAREWWLEASGLFREGLWLAADYGRDTEYVLDPTRPAGTLRAYRRHRQSDDPLADPGGQDLTAHVDWRRIRETGEKSGLNTHIFETQGQFLVGAAREAGWFEEGARLSDPAEVRRFQTLMHPGQMGNRFQILVQNRGELWT